MSTKSMTRGKNTTTKIEGIIQGETGMIEGSSMITTTMGMSTIRKGAGTEIANSSIAIEEEEGDRSTTEIMISPPDKITSRSRLGTIREKRIATTRRGATEETNTSNHRRTTKRMTKEKGTKSRRNLKITRGK